MRVSRRSGAILLAAAVLSPVGGGPGEAQERRVTVFAAASLTDAFRGLQGPFERKHPGWKLRFNFAASSLLRVQIEQGAPADVFASADPAQMHTLAATRWVVSPQVFARNGLVVVVPAGNPGRLQSAQDLGRPGLRIIGTGESVPIGRYSRQVLTKLAGTAGFPRDFAARVERNIVSREANVRAVLAKVELGEGDAALVYQSDARSSRRVHIITLPAAANIVAQYPIAVTAGAPQRAGAQAFVQFVQSREGRAVLRRYGFQ